MPAALPPFGATVPGWSRYRGFNCYTGQGGIEYARVADEPEGFGFAIVASVEACIAHCRLGRGKCGAVVMRRCIGRPSGQNFECWLRAEVDLTECDRFNVNGSPHRHFTTFAPNAGRGLARSLLSPRELDALGGRLDVQLDASGGGWGGWFALNGAAPQTAGRNASGNDAWVWNPHRVNAHNVIVNVRRRDLRMVAGSSVLEGAADGSERRQHLSQASPAGRADRRQLPAHGDQHNAAAQPHHVHDLQHSVTHVTLVWLRLGDGNGASTGSGQGPAPRSSGSTLSVRRVISDAEDPRVVRLPDQTLLFFSRYAGRQRRRLWLATIRGRIESGEIRQIPLSYAQARKQEGNWLPFTYAGRVYVSYTLCPHMVLLVNLTSGECTPAYHSIPEGCSVHDRGSASAVVSMDDDGTLVGLGHHRHGSRYLHWLFKREAAPPFRIVARSRTFQLPLSLSLHPNAGMFADDVQFCLSLRAVGAVSNRSHIAFDYSAGDAVALTARWTRERYCRFTGWCVPREAWPRVRCEDMAKARGRIGRAGIACEPI